MMGVTSMSSFSDAHEVKEIPIVAANVQRLVPLRKSQIWAVLRETDSLQRLQYSLSAAFLGRMCLSGEIDSLSAEQYALVEQAMQLYRNAVPILKEGISTIHRNCNKSMRNPEGIQAVLRVSATGEQALLVWHAFALDKATSVQVQIPAGSWRTMSSFSGAGSVTISEGGIEVAASDAWSGGVVILEAAPKSARLKEAKSLSRV
jgi:alpha-galactosidase